MKFFVGSPPEMAAFDARRDGWTLVPEPGKAAFMGIGLAVAVGVGLAILGVLFLCGTNIDALTDVRHIPYGIGIILALIPLHEFLHLICLPGLGFDGHTWVGICPAFGGICVLYDAILQRNRFVLVAACPAVVLTGLPLLAAIVLHGIPMTLVAVCYLNAMLSAVDVAAIVIVLCQVPGDAQLRNKGFRTYWRSSRTR